MITTLLKSATVSLNLLVLSSIALANVQKPIDPTPADEPEIIECSNGTVEEVGDALFMVTVFEDGLEVSRYESSFVLDPTSVRYTAALNGWTVAIEDVVVEVSGEGETWTERTDGLIIMDLSKLSMSVLLATDGGEPIIRTLSCRRR